MAENLVLWPISGAVTEFYALKIVRQLSKQSYLWKESAENNQSQGSVHIWDAEITFYSYTKAIRISYQNTPQTPFNILPSTQLLMFLVFVFEWLDIEDKIIPQRNNLNVRIPMFYYCQCLRKTLYLTPIKCQIQGFPQTPMICQGKNWSTGLQGKSCCTWLL